MFQLIKKGCNHLKRNNMTYYEHFVFAFYHGLQCFKASVFLIIHSILPCFFEKAGSKLVHKLEQVFTERESKTNEPKSNI
jgi:hypothetical protein